jgi:1-acyl-sn-glycerol-3-phosphate acyltransferase
MQVTDFYILVGFIFFVILMNMQIVTLPKSRWEAILRLFYRRIHIVNPMTKSNHATIVIANHANGFIDPFAIEAALGVKLTRTVRADWTKHWLVKWFVSAVNAVPLAKNRNNSKSFKSLLQSLNQGKPVILFPEGQSHNRTKLKSFRKGTAYLAKKYIEMTGKPVRIVKVAIYYEDKSRLNSDIWVDVIGESTYTQPDFSVCEETKAWQNDINNALPSYIRKDDKQRLNWVLQTLHSINPKTVTSLNVFRLDDNSSQMNLLRHWLVRAQFNLSALEKGQSTLCHLCKAIAHTVVFVTGLPIFIVGVISNTPAIIAHYSITSIQSHAEDKWASNTFIIGMSIYPLFWLVLAWFSTPIIALIVALTGFYANFYAQTWVDRKQKLITHFGCLSQPQACNFVRTVANETIDASFTETTQTLKPMLINSHN